MTALRRHLLPLSILLLTGLATPSLAAIPNGDCLWNTIPATQRTQLMDNYRAKGMASITELVISDELTLDLRKTCKFSAADDYKAGEILAGTLVVKGADQMLFERSKIARGSLDKAWARLSAADRESLTVFGLSIMANGSDGAPQAAAVITRVTGDLGLPTDALNDDVYGYLIGRAVVEARQVGR